MFDITNGYSTSNELCVAYDHGLVIQEYHVGVILTYTADFLVDLLHRILLRVITIHQGQIMSNIINVRNKNKYKYMDTPHCQEQSTLFEKWRLVTARTPRSLLPQPVQYYLQIDQIKWNKIRRYKDKQNNP